MKKILAVMAALCALGCSGNVNPLQSGDDIVTTASPHDMTNDQLRNKIVKALDDMKAKADEMCIRGVASIPAAAGPSWTVRMYWESTSTSSRNGNLHMHGPG
jgi:hypothetical protein